MLNSPWGMSLSLTDPADYCHAHAAEYLKKHIDHLGPDVYAIEVSEIGDLLSVSTDPDHDETMCPHYPPIRELQRPGGVQTVSRSELLELDRLGPNVDLVSYETHGLTDEEGQPKRRRVVFKYYFHLQFLHQRWDEVNVWMRLPPHPHIVPFDRLVTEELYGQQRVVGFTTLHISGGTLGGIHENPSDSRVFKLKWLKQLTNLIDDLNFKFVIQHQDVAPRNLLVDETADNIMLFDFNFSARIGGPLRDGGQVYWENRDDVKGLVFTLYEIVTRDDHFRSVPHWQQDVSSVLDMKEWTQHPDVRLDHPLPEFRAVLDEWLRTRKERGNIAVFTDASEYIDWPKMNEPPCFPDEDPLQESPHEDTLSSVKTPSQGNLDSPEEAPGDISYGDYVENREPEYGGYDGEIQTPRWCFSRRNERNSHRQVIEWERPPQTKFKEGTRVFADGKVIEVPRMPS